MPVLEIHQAGLAGALPVADGHIEHQVFVPADEGIAHQAGDVVGNRAVDGILEVEHAQRLAGGIAQHQVARHEVAVHIHLRRGQIALHDQVERGLQHLVLLGRELVLAVLRHIPLGEQLQLAAQQRLVIGRQHLRSRGQLPGQQHIQRPQVVRLRRLGLLGVEGAYHGGVPEVGEQHEAVGFIPLQHARCMQAGFFHQPRHMHEGVAVFLLGRCVHDDAGRLPGSPLDAQITAEAGVGAGDLQRVRLQAVARGHAGQPGIEQGSTGGIGPADGRGRRREGHGTTGNGENSSHATRPGRAQVAIVCSHALPVST